MLPSKQRLCHHRSVEDFLHPDHAWRAEFPSSDIETTEDSQGSSQEDEDVTDTESETTEFDDPIHRTPVEGLDWGEENMPFESPTEPGNNWEIQMLAQEMIKQESVTSKKELPDVVEEDEEEDDDYDDTAEDEEDDDGLTEGTEVEDDDVQRVLNSGSQMGWACPKPIGRLNAEVQIDDPESEAKKISKSFPRKLHRQKSWAGEPHHIYSMPRRRDSLPTADECVIQHFVHSTLRRLDKLEKVFTRVGGNPTPISVKNTTDTSCSVGTQSAHRHLAHQHSLQEPSTQTHPESDIVSADVSPLSKHNALHRHSSFGETTSHHALSLLNIPLQESSRTSMQSLKGIPLLPTTSLSPTSPTSPSRPMARAMSTINVSSHLFF